MMPPQPQPYDDMAAMAQIPEVPAPEVDFESALGAEREGAVAAAAMGKPTEPLDPALVQNIATMFAQINDTLSGGEIPSPEIPMDAQEIPDDLYASLKGLAGALVQTRAGAEAGAALEQALAAPGGQGGAATLDALSAIATDGAIIAELTGEGADHEAAEAPAQEAAEMADPKEDEEDDFATMGM